MLMFWVYILDNTESLFGGLQDYGDHLKRRHATFFLHYVNVVRDFQDMTLLWRHEFCL